VRSRTSVLFGDLVGFTTLAESRDPEEVRELLSRYFAECRTVIGRYGGVVEKFIGGAIGFAAAAGARSLVLFHHGPARTDDQLEEILRGIDPPMPVTLARQGAVLDVAKIRERTGDRLSRSPVEPSRLREEWRRRRGRSSTRPSS